MDNEAGWMSASLNPGEGILFQSLLGCSPGVLAKFRCLGPTSGLQGPTLGLGQEIHISTRLPSELPVDRQYKALSGRGLEMQDPGIHLGLRQDPQFNKIPGLQVC